ncbi:exonuclease [environmental Halophage eHP-31]|nr:exonuclease [environmental Halophage eHP-31]
MTDRIMVDIETLGRDPGCAIVEIGAVEFVAGPVVGDGDADPIGATFATSVGLESCQTAGLEIDAGTLAWWLKQDAPARGQLQGGETLSRALREFREFVAEADEVWANSPAFDIAILEAAFEAVGLSAPWRYWMTRDYRTMREVLSASGDWPDREQSGTDHDALDDARYQARCLSEGLAAMESQQ